MVVGVLVVGAALATVGLVLRGRDAAPPASGSAVEPRREQPAPPGPDPWAQSSQLTGNKVSIGQGVSLVIPPGFQITTKNGVTAAMDSRGVLIAAGAIEIDSNDPQELAKYHARRNQLVFDKMERVFVGGVERPAAMFHGTFNGVAVSHVAVPLIGLGYRVAVVMQVPKKIEDEPEIEGLALELYTRRIELP